MIIRGQAIIDFLEGKTTDYKDRSFASLLKWTDEQLENCHDQCQWCFPLHEESNYANTYPIVDKDVIQKINESAEVSHKIKCNLIKAKDRFEKFYGLGKYEDTNKQVKWCRNGNHNLLRITRIIRCLRLFGLEEEARDFYNKVELVGHELGISYITIDYWNRALLQNVWSSLR